MIVLYIIILILMCHLLCELIFWVGFYLRENGLPGIISIWDFHHYRLLLNWGLPNYLILENLQKYFGPVFQYKWGNSNTIAVMDMDLAKQIMSSSDLVNRLPEGNVLYERSFKKPLGILFGNGSDWSVCRNFASKTLFKLGFGRGSRMESHILNEIQTILPKLEDMAAKGNIFKPHGFFHVPTLNILWYVMAGSKFSHDDPLIIKLLKFTDDWNRSFNLGATWLHAYPWLRHIPKITEHDYWVNGHNYFYDFFRKIMKERLDEKKYLEDPGDFIDYFLREMHYGRTSDGVEFNEENFLVICTDLFMAGADTTSSTLEYAILFLALNPRVQRKIHQEIDAVIGHGNTPCLSFKKLMIYTEATTLEILRHSCTIPVTGRCPASNMAINNCPISKDAILAINIHGIHFSSKIWPDPEAFKPERFLNDDGDIVNLDKIMPFGYGKRKCMGENTSRNTLFLFMVSLLQKFTFELSPDHPSPSLKEVCGLSRAPQPYYVRILLR